jgi:hypothetical protein
MESKANNLIERYVHDVARRLPEKEREDVKKELRANIYDMLPEGASEDAVKKVLYELGSPVSLAEKYRTRPRYLISPAYFDEYVSVLRWILPLVGVLVMLIGFAVGAVEAAKDAATSMPFAVSGIISKGVSMGVSAAFQALIWTTIGFVIAEHSGQKKEKVGEHGWRVEDLPEVQNPKASIPLSEGIAELVLSVVFSILAILFCLGYLPFMMAFSHGGTVFFNIFSQSFLTMLIPFTLVSLLFAVVESVAKIKDRRWSVFVCASSVVKKLVDMALTLYLINQPNILSTEFHSFLAETGVLQVLPSVNGTNVIVLAFCVLLIIGTLADVITTITKTVKAHAR